MLIARGNRATPAKAVVDAGLDGVLVIPEAGADDISRTAGEGVATKVVILVLDLGRPVRREHVFETGADGVAILVVAVRAECHRNAAAGRGNIRVVAPGVAALGVQQRRTPSVAKPAGDRTELI